MLIEVDPAGLIATLLGLSVSEDDAVVIGHSRIAWLSQNDPAHMFIDDAKWHDAAYLDGASIQGPQGMSRWQVDLEFLNKMLTRAGNEYSSGRLSKSQHQELETVAVELFLIVRKYCDKFYEGPQK